MFLALCGVIVCAVQRVHVVCLGPTHGDVTKYHMAGIAKRFHYDDVSVLK